MVSTWILVRFGTLLYLFSLTIRANPRGNKGTTENVAPKQKNSLRRQQSNKSNNNSTGTHHNNRIINIDHLFTIDNFLQPEIYQQYLPRVCILPISPSFYQLAIDYHLEKKAGLSSHSMILHEHSHDLLLFHWLLTYYEKTIQMVYLPKRKMYVYLPTHPQYDEAMKVSPANIRKGNKRYTIKNGMLTTVEEAGETVVDTFFMPTGMPNLLTDFTNSYWKALDKEIEQLVLLNYQPQIFKTKVSKKKTATSKTPVPALSTVNANNRKNTSLNDFPKISKENSAERIKEQTSIKDDDESEIGDSESLMDRDANVKITGKDDSSDNEEFESELERMKFAGKNHNDKSIELVSAESTDAKISNRRRLQDEAALKDFMEKFVKRAPLSPSDKILKSFASTTNSSSLFNQLSSTYYSPFFPQSFNESDLIRKSLRNYTFPFKLENTFLAASYLDQTKPIQYLYHFLRNVRDLHYLRVDNELTPNGRDITIPYHILRLRYQILTNINTTLSLHPKVRIQKFQNNLHSTINHIQLFKKRKYFYMIACREPPGQGENTRKYRTSMYDQLKGYSKDAYILKKMTQFQFDYGMFNSDFCFILPGDTSSTSKLYKAIYSNCIPVIFLSYPSQLPFHHFLQWNQFAIIVYKDMIKNSLQLKQFLNYLMKMRNSPEQIHNWKKNVYLASELFDYEKYDFPSVYHLILMELQYMIQQEQQYASFLY